MDKENNKGLRETPTSMPSNDNYREGYDSIFGKEDKLSKDGELESPLEELTDIPKL